MAALCVRPSPRPSLTTFVISRTTFVIMKTLADRLRWARESRGWSMRQCDRVAGLAVGHTSMVETGRRTDPSVRTVASLAHALGVSLDWLVDGTGPTPKLRH